MYVAKIFLNVVKRGLNVRKKEIISQNISRRNNPTLPAQRILSLVLNKTKLLETDRFASPELKG